MSTTTHETSKRRPETGRGASNKPLAVFTLADHLAHRWTDELVGFEVANLTVGQPLAIQDTAGNLLPCQIAGNRVYFVVKELPPLAKQEFALVPAVAKEQSPSVRTADGTVELDNRLIAVRLPAAQKLTTVPAPILAVRRGQGTEAQVGAASPPAWPKPLRRGEGPPLRTAATTPVAAGTPLPPLTVREPGWARGGSRFRPS